MPGLPGTKAEPDCRAPLNGARPNLAGGRSITNQASPAAEPRSRPNSLGRLAVQLLSALGALASVVALAALGIRALVHLDPSYDTFSYHLPFAAQRVGIV